MGLILYQCFMQARDFRRKIQKQELKRLKKKSFFKQNNTRRYFLWLIRAMESLMSECPKGLKTAEQMTTKCSLE